MTLNLMLRLSESTKEREGIKEIKKEQHKSEKIYNVKKLKMYVMETTKGINR